MQFIRPFLTALLLVACAAPAAAQTIKTLGYNTINGQVVANTGTNVLTFTNADLVFQEGIVANEVKAPSGDVVSVTSWDTNSQIILDSNQISIYADILGVHVPVSFAGTNASVNAATSRTNLGLSLAALTNTSNIAMMRALAGSTNTNHPYSGNISVVGTNNTNTLVFSNGILQSVQ